MFIRKRISKALALAALSAAVVAAVSVWQAKRVEAISDSEWVVSFGVLSLAPGQAARLSVVNTKAIGDEENAPGDRRQAVRVTLAFDIYGIRDEVNTPGPGGAAPGEEVACQNNLRLLRREACEATLMPGEAASFEFTAAGDGTRIGAVMIQDSERRNNGAPQPHLATTLEVMEGARTVFVAPAAAKGFNPQPDPPGRR